MQPGSLLRAWIGITTACIFVLQMLMVTIVATQMALAVATPLASAPICSLGVHQDESQHPPTGPPLDQRHPCAACWFAPVAAVPPPVTAIALVRKDAAVIAWRPPGTPTVHPHVHHPKLSQGPPRHA